MLIFIPGERAGEERDIGERLTHFQASKPESGNIYYDIQSILLTTA